MNARRWTILLALFLAAGVVRAEDKKDEKPPAKPKPVITAEDEALMKRMPRTVSGVVWLDRNGDGRRDPGEGLPDVRVTDGVHFVKTDKLGRYTIDIRPDPMIPFTPTLVVNVCWPDGTWPVRRDPKGRWSWWMRLKDATDPQNVDFRLVPREPRLPVCVAFGTDPHDNMAREFNLVYSDEVGQAGDHVDFGVLCGDLGYIGLDNAPEAYTSIEKFTNNFPVMLIHAIGNHDVTSGPEIMKEYACQGGFTKHLGPVHWSFDMAGSHFVAFNWPMIDDTGIAWLEQDLQSVPKDRPVYLFIHMWDKFLGPICEKYPNLKLVLAGHSHRNIHAGKEGQAEFWTKMSLYTLLYVHKDGFEFVDRCIYEGARTGWDGPWQHHGSACALYNVMPELTDKDYKAQHVGVKDVKLDSKAQEIKTVPGPTYDLRFGARYAGDKLARRWGLRVTAKDGKVREFSFDTQANMLDLMGLKTYFTPTSPHMNSAGRPETLKGEEQQWIEMRILVMPEKVRVLVNSRLHYQKFIALGEAGKIEFFAEGGAAEFGRVDVWQRTYPKDYKPGPQANSG